MSTKKLQIVTPIVTSVNGETGDVELNSLKNPNALTFTGGATGSYDGSSAKTVAIPSVDSVLSSTSTNPVQNKIVNSAINAIKTDIGDINTIGNIDTTVCDAIITLNSNKVDKIDGKSLSTNDYTTTEKNKLAGIAEGANKTTVPTNVSAFTNDAKYATTTYVDDGLSSKQDAGDYATNTALTSGLSGKADSSHKHSASDITSGTLPIARGGTNATTASSARTNLGFSYGTSVPTSAPSTGNGAVFFCQDDGSPLAIADGGTGATTAANARGNLGLSYDTLFPVGYIYMSTVATSPAELFGGTWEPIKDVFLLAAGDSYSAGKTGGEAEHTLTQEELPAAAWTSGSGTGGVETSTSGAAGVGYGMRTQCTDWGQAHNNMPPYLAVYVWKRTK